MIDYFSNTIEEGDVILQAHEYGMFFYEVTRDPEETKLVHVTSLNDDNRTVIHKRPDHIVDLTALLANFPYRDEVIRHLRSEWKAANGR